MITTMLSLFGAAKCAPPEFFGFKAWYAYLNTDSNCNIVSFRLLYKLKDPSDAYRSDLFLVALAIVDDLLRLAGLIAIGYVIYGGILYITSQGQPDATSKAQHTIQNALIGLVISILAIALVTFLGAKIA